MISAWLTKLTKQGSNSFCCWKEPLILWKTLKMHETIWEKIWSVFGPFLLRQAFSCRDNLKVETTDTMGEILFKSVPEQG